MDFGTATPAFTGSHFLQVVGEQLGFMDRGVGGGWDQTSTSRSPDVKQETDGAWTLAKQKPKAGDRQQPMENLESPPDLEL